MNQEASGWRPIFIKHAGNCSECGIHFPEGSKALWNPSLHRIKCLAHANSNSGQPDEPSFTDNETDSPNSELLINLGTPGGSAKAQADRRIQKRKESVNKRFPRFGKFILALSEEPRETRAWQSGAQGEFGIGLELEKLATKYKFQVLHDRLIPNSRANIDHIAITSAGIFVIDSKKYHGEIRIVKSRGFYSESNPKLWIGGKNCMHLVHGVKKQVNVVEKVLYDFSIEMSVVGVLAFYRGNWEPFSLSMSQEVIQNVFINNKGIHQIVNRQGTYTPDEIDRVSRILVANLLPAT